MFQKKNQIELMEVSLRDGLQNEKAILSVEQKLDILENLIALKVDQIELASFVHPKRVPQMKNSDDFVKAATLKYPNAKFSGLAPNEKGLERLLKAGLKNANLLYSISLTHNQKNIGSSINESKSKIKNCLKMLSKGSKKRLYLSCIFDCPFEGQTNFNKVLPEIIWALENNFDEISLGDTIGSANFIRTEELISLIDKKLPEAKESIFWHFHNTKGQAISNITICSKAGFFKFDSSLGGIGGCPFAPGARGNVATEEIAYAFSKTQTKICAVDSDDSESRANWLRNLISKNS